MDSSNLTIRSAVIDKDVIIQGNDGGANITALTLDMSEAGAASFNSTVTANAGVIVDNITIDGTEIDLSSGDLTIDVAGDIILDADGGDVKINDGGVAIAELTNSSTDFVIKSVTNDKDIIFKGVDNSSVITALTLDMSAAGAATFNNDVTAFSDERLKENITVIPNAIEKVSQIRGVTYTRNDQKDKEKVYAGVIAQEVEKVLPEVVNTTEDDTKTVAYGNMVGLLIEAVKEQQEQINQLKKQIEEMK